MDLRALFLLSAPLLAASASPDGRVRIGSGKFNMKGWTQAGRAPKDAKIELIFAVKQTNVDKLESLFHEVSNPKSAFYGKHLTNDEVHTLLAPKPEHLSALNSFLKSHGIAGVPATPNSDMVSATVTIETAERLLNATYHSYTHPDTAHVAHRTQLYSLPSDVASAIDFTAPTIALPPVNRPLQYTGGSRRTNEHLGVGAKKLRSLYSVDDFVGSAEKNRHAVTAFLKQHFHPADLKEFWALMMGGVDAKCPVVKQVGDGVTGLSAGVEAELDIEYINALGSGIKSEFWGFSGNSPDNPQNEPFLKWLAVVSNTSDADVPLVFSTSYGEPEDSTTQDTADRTNVEFMKAGARGISLLFASGDSGAGCDNQQYVPNWPAGSPYVTGVGGTTGVPEEAVGLASGGFCNRWPVQKWQEDAVNTYFSTGQKIPDQKYYNKTGRGFPDISAQATGFLVVANLIPNPGVAGTSCASPTAAGVMALLNDVRLAAGKSSLGFLNPFIYQNAAAFNDITNGANSGCNGDAGFFAEKGWDPVTGVGTPNFAKLKAVVAQLP